MWVKKKRGTQVGSHWEEAGEPMRGDAGVLTGRGGQKIGTCTRKEEWILDILFP